MLPAPAYFHNIPQPSELTPYETHTDAVHTSCGHAAYQSPLMLGICAAGKILLECLLQPMPDCVGSSATVFFICAVELLLATKC